MCYGTKEESARSCFRQDWGRKGWKDARRKTVAGATPRDCAEGSPEPLGEIQKKRGGTLITPYFSATCCAPQEALAELSPIRSGWDAHPLKPQGASLIRPQIAAVSHVQGTSILPTIPRGFKRRTIELVLFLGRTAIGRAKRLNSECYRRC